MMRETVGLLILVFFAAGGMVAVVGILMFSVPDSLIATFMVVNGLLVCAGLWLMRTR
jgi:hypothetical protein